MNGTSGLQEVRSSTSRSPSYRYRFLHEQQPQVGTGSWHLPRTHDLTALSSGINTMKKGSGTVYFTTLRAPSRIQLGTAVRFKPQGSRSYETAILR